MRPTSPFSSIPSSPSMREVPAALRAQARKRIIGGCLAAAFCVATQSAQALTVFVERLTYTQNGAIIFQDDFNDPASVPNFTGGNTASYFTFGSPGPEANGKLRLSTDNGALSASASGIPTIATRIRLNNNINPNNPIGIRPDLIFGASVLVDLPAAGFGVGESFSLRLGEFTPGGTIVRGLQLRVGRIGDAAPRVAYRVEDFQADTITTLNSSPLVIPGGADQMLLMFDRASVNSLVTGAFQFFDNGVEDGALVTLGSGATPFVFEDRMRIDVLVSTTVVPVPGSLALLLSGVVMAGLAARKRGRKHGAAAL